MISLIPVVVTVLLVVLCIHPVIINEGHVGTVFHLGALSSTILHPGLTYEIFFLRRVHEIQVTTQTDAVENVPCATNNGVLMEFSRVEVVNRLPVEHVHDVVKRYSPNYDRYLIFSKIPAAMMQFCSKHSFNEVYIEKFSTLDEFLMEELQRSLAADKVGLQVIDVRFGKPNIPNSMASQYAKLQQLETDKQLALKEHELTIQKNAEKAQQTLAIIETERKRKLAEKESDNQQELTLIRVLHEQAMARLNSSREQEQMQLHGKIFVDQIENDRNVTLLAYKKNRLVEEAQLQSQIDLMQANVSHKISLLRSEANKELHTVAYVQMEVAKSLASNTKIYWGDKLPQMMPQMMAWIVPPPNASSRSSCPLTVLEQ